MSNVLKGNFSTKNQVISDKKSENIETRFEREALAKLGGSIAYVSRKKFVWTGDKPLVGRAQQYDTQNAHPSKDVGRPPTK